MSERFNGFLRFGRYLEHGFQILSGLSQAPQAVISTAASKERRNIARIQTECGGELAQCLLRPIAGEVILPEIEVGRRSLGRVAHRGLVKNEGRIEIPSSRVIRAQRQVEIVLLPEMSDRLRG